MNGFRKRLLHLSLIIVLFYMIGSGERGVNASVVWTYPTPLRVLIGVPMNSRGVRAIGDQNGIRFPVIIQNISDIPLKIWDESGRLGYDIVTLEVTKVNGKPLSSSIIVNKGFMFWSGDGNSLLAETTSSETIEPKEAMVRVLQIHIPRYAPAEKVILDPEFGSTYFNLPLPKPGCSLTLTIRAVLKISPVDGNPLSHGIWIGEIASPEHDYVIYRPNETTTAGQP